MSTISIGTPFQFDDVLLGLIVAVGIMLATSALTRRSAEHTTIMTALATKLLISFAYSYFAVFLANASDSLDYHSSGVTYAHGLRADLATGSAGYFTQHPTYWLGANNRENIIGITGILHALLFDSFLATSVVFAVLGFIGQVFIYKTFVACYPDTRTRFWWRAGILFFPTLVFWSSGILKDSLGIFGLGCTLWGIYLLLQQFRPRYLVLTIYGTYTMFIFRAQIAPALFVALIPWMLQPLKAGGEGPRVARPSHRVNIVVRVMLLAGSLLGFLVLGALVPRFSLVNLPHTILELNGTFQRQPGLQTGVYAPIAPLVTDVSWGGLIKAWPEALLLSLYRPFPWEAANLTARLAAAENMVLAALTVRFFLQLLIYRRIIRRLVRAPLFLTCVIFVAIFALGVGASTPDLGTISRYRIPLIPFLIGALIIAQYHVIEYRDQTRAPYGT